MKVIEGYLLDTNIASASWNKRAPLHSHVRERLEELGDVLVYLAVVSIAEVEYGRQVAPVIDTAQQAEVRGAMGGCAVLQIDRHTAQTYAEIRAILFRTYAPRDRRGRITQTYVEDLVERTTGKELGIQENDLWIVSVAVQYNLIFATNDRMQRVMEASQYSHRRSTGPKSTSTAWSVVVI